MIEAVILDFDGLILDTETPFQRAWEEIYEEHGLSVPDGVWAELIGSTVDPQGAYALLERHIGRPVDRAAVRSRREARELELLQHQRVLPGVRDLLDEATARGLRLAVASSSDRAWVVGHLKRIGLFERFDTIACAEDVAATKPAPDLYEVALHRLGLRADRAIAFEDSVYGVAAAKAAGLFCVAVPNGVTRHHPLGDADRIVETLADRSLEAFLQAAEAHYAGLSDGSPLGGRPDRDV